MNPIKIYEENCNKIIACQRFKQQEKRAQLAMKTQEKHKNPGPNTTKPKPTDTDGSGSN